MERHDMYDEIYEDDMVMRVERIGSLTSRHIASNDVGPAGLCSVPLIDGTVLHVDYAEPERLISFEAGTDRAVLAGLVGDARADAVMSLDGLPDDRAIRLPGTASQRRPGRATSRPSGGRKAIEMGQLATLISIHEDTDELAVVRAVAGFEFAARASRSEARSMLDPDMAASVVEASLDMAMSAPDEVMFLAGRKMKLASEVSRVVGEATAAVGMPEPSTLIDMLHRVRSLDDRRRPPEFELRPVAAASVRLESFAFRSFGDDDVVSDDDLSAILDSAIAGTDDSQRLATEPTLVINRRGRLEMAWRSEPEAEWVRVLRAGTQVLVALAPIVRTGEMWIAEALIPSEFGVGDVSVDLLDGETALTPGTRAEQVRAAVELGRQAVGASVGRGAVASDLWQQCADAWEAIGDGRRAERARAYAEGFLEVTRRELLADMVRGVVDRL
jgi:hypothetical protein